MEVGTAAGGRALASRLACCPLHRCPPAPRQAPGAEWRAQACRTTGSPRFCAEARKAVIVAMAGDKAALQAYKDKVSDSKNQVPNLKDLIDLGSYKMLAENLGKETAHSIVRFSEQQGCQQAHRHGRL